MINNDINERFREVREDKGLTQDQFGKPMGMTRDEVKNIEYKKTSLKKEKIPLFCAAYNVNERWFVTGEPPKYRSEPLGDLLGSISAKAAQNTVEDAETFFRNAREQIGDAGLLMVYEVLRQLMPQFDIDQPKKKDKE